MNAPRRFHRPDRVSGSILLACLLVAGAAHGEGLRWDALDKLVEVPGGRTNHTVTFTCTNRSPTNIVINAIRTSCGCTEVRAPGLPWTLRPGASGRISFSTDLRGKYGRLFKSAAIESSAGTQRLRFTLHINAMEALVRARNQSLAKADPQAVFRGRCAACHAAPTRGKEGGALYLAACGICHEAEHRASMVPNLHLIALPGSEAEWHRLIDGGKPGTLMPAFAERAGGPLNERQIESLARYLRVAFPRVNGGQ